MEEITGSFAVSTGFDRTGEGVVAFDRALLRRREEFLGQKRKKSPTLCRTFCVGEKRYDFFRVYASRGKGGLRSHVESDV